MFETILILINFSNSLQTRNLAYLLRLLRLSEWSFLDGRIIKKIRQEMFFL